MTKRKLRHPSTKKLKSLVHKVKGKKILVIGDIGIDCYLHGKVERISPEAPVPVLFVQEEKMKLGLAANVADNIQALSAKSLLVGVVGNDKAGNDLSELLRSAGAAASYLVRDPFRKTILKTRMVAQGQQLIRIDQETPSDISPYVEEKVMAQILGAITECDAIILEDYAKGMITFRLAREIFRLAKKHKKIITVDPNLKTPAPYYVGATCLTPNTGEAEKLSGIKIDSDETLLEAGHKILRTTNAKSLIITQGKDGMAIFGQDGSLQKIPTFAREVFDVSGAGDTVISVLTLCLAAGATLYEAAILANIAAGIEVSKPGTATVSVGEILKAL